MELRKVTLIVAAPDCSSVQSVACYSSGNKCTSVSGIYSEVDWLKDFEVIALVDGWPDLQVRDDSRVSERGVQ